MGVNGVYEIALAVAYNVIISQVEQNIDFCFDEYRIIIEIDGKEDNLRLKNAEILDSDWQLLIKESSYLSQKINEIIVQYNESCRMMIRQEKEIKNDRHW